MAAHVRSVLSVDMTVSDQTVIKENKSVSLWQDRGIVYTKFLMRDGCHPDNPLEPNAVKGFSGLVTPC